ncbi:uncharacterized protein [Spinacia oleracea]|uniref:Uncharacterized protein n=1 Tax=Spinacia oleracea TaxID=3562 RepID=A0ABM3RH65_SPIOL|nr:uncharacterized protein LOC130469599 [Spinacia oleracea]
MEAAEAGGDREGWTEVGGWIGGGRIRREEIRGGRRFDELPVEDGKAVQWPPKSSKPDSKKDPSKWFDFHADIGHTTNECVALRREVAYLLKNGHLKDVISDKARGVINKYISNSPSRPPPPHPHTKTVNFIAGGSDVCGDISDKHHDGLVISIPVGNCMIRQVIVDSGSSTKL